MLLSLWKRPRPVQCMISYQSVGHSKAIYITMAWMNFVYWLGRVCSIVLVSKVWPLLMKNTIDILCRRRCVCFAFTHKQCSISFFYQFYQQQPKEPNNWQCSLTFIAIPSSTFDIAGHFFGLFCIINQALSLNLLNRSSQHSQAIFYPFLCHCSTLLWNVPRDFLNHLFYF